MSKGTVADLFFIIVVMVALAITFLIAMHLKDQLVPEIRSQITGQASGEILDLLDYTGSVFDYMFLIFSVGGGIATLLLAWQVKFHPAFFFMNILLITILMLVVPVLSNVVRDIWLQDVFLTYENRFPFMLNIMRFLPYFFLSFSFLLSVVMFSKSREQP